MKKIEMTVENKSANEIGRLVSLAQGGDQFAFEKLQSIYLPLLENQSSRHIQPDMTVQDIEDLKQEALIVFGNAVNSYNHEISGVEFGLYAKICIENRLVSYVRSYWRQRRSQVVPLDDVENVSDNNTKDIFQAMADREGGEELVRSIKTVLSEYENRIWWLYVSGMTVSRIAETVGAPDAKSVSNAVYRIRKKLREQIFERNTPK